LTTDAKTSPGSWWDWAWTGDARKRYV